ncbi:IS1 family transposase [bacterium SCSIO 12741]|nr:IS1 family transposase [bacterium SCSIO 12741]
MCIRCVDEILKCQKCQARCVKNGKTRSGIQRYLCKACGKTKQSGYTYKALIGNINQQIVRFLKEGLGIRNIARLLEISTNTVNRRILEIGAKVEKPMVSMNQNYELDELKTYVKFKRNEMYVGYALNPETGQVANFMAGKRNKRNLKLITDTLLFSRAKRVDTDGLNIYKSLLPREIHRIKHRGINHIERMNLTLRTHLKRLNRRTICFSKSLRCLKAVLKIYFWADPERV